MSVTNFIPTIWSARLLEHLNKTHVYACLLYTSDAADD